MVYRTFEPVSKQLTIIVGLTVVGFMAFGLALSFYRNMLFETTLYDIGNENKKLESQIAESRNQLDYFQSAQYKDKYAKQNLGRINPGEKILIITEEPPSPHLSIGDAFTPTQAQQAAYEEHLRQIPVFLHWELFLFEREKMQQLKRGIL